MSAELVPVFVEPVFIPEPRGPLVSVSDSGRLSEFVLSTLVWDGEFSLAEEANETVLNRNDRYRHIKFTELEEPSLADEARRIHAEGYHAMGFVSDDALTADGFLAEGIDKSQGPLTDYYLGLNPDKETDAATMRKIKLPIGATYKDLPAYKVSEQGLSEEGLGLLKELHESGFQFVEIAAMAKTKRGNAFGAHEVIRNAMQESVGKNEIWMFSIVSSTFDTLIKSWGEHNFIVLGEDAPIDDPRVSGDIALRPAILCPDSFLENLHKSYVAAKTPQDRHRLRRSFMFHADGVDMSTVSSDLAETYQNITAEKAQK